MQLCRPHYLPPSNSCNQPHKTKSHYILSQVINKRRVSPKIDGTLTERARSGRNKIQSARGIIFHGTEKAEREVEVNGEDVNNAS